MSRPDVGQPATESATFPAGAWAQAAAACARSAELQQWTAHVLTEARAARQTSAEARRLRRSSPAGRDLIQRSEHARLLARLETEQSLAEGAAIASHRLW